MDTFAEWLAGLLARRGITQTQFAAYIGVRPSSVNEWLHGKRIPRAPACEAIAKYANIPVEEVLRIAGHLSGGEEDREPERPRSIREDAVEFLAALPFEVPIFEDAPIHAGNAGVPIQIAYLPAMQRKRESIVGFLVRSDCMEPVIHDGDVVIIDLEESPRDGQVVAVETDDGWSLRRYTVTGRQPKFECDKPASPDAQVPVAIIP